LGTFEVFDHTADVGLRVRGESLEDLLATAARAAFDQMLEDWPAEIAVEDDVSAVPSEAIGPDLAEAFVDWLQELLYRFETARLVPLRYAFTAAGPEGIKARVGFGRFESGRHRTRLEVKAVTYHELDVHREPDGRWMARFILDV